MIFRREMVKGEEEGEKMKMIPIYRSGELRYGDCDEVAGARILKGVGQC